MAYVMSHAYGTLVGASVASVLRRQEEDQSRPTSSIAAFGLNQPVLMALLSQETRRLQHRENRGDRQDLFGRGGRAPANGALHDGSKGCYS